jgi:hypothetical protein
VKILRMLWEIIFPFEIVWLTPEQESLRKLAHKRFSSTGNYTTQAGKVLLMPEERRKNEEFNKKAAV